MKVGIVGAGLTGLTAAYRLARAGHRVQVFERFPEAGGEVATFQVGGGRIEKLYHHLFSRDDSFIALLDELGLRDRLLWLDSRVGFAYGSRLFPFVTPGDLLRFTPIGLLDRFRLGLCGLYLRRQKDWRRYEGVTARQWITKYAGKRSYDVVWGPLLRGKFGDQADQVEMTWFWSKIYIRFASRKGLGQRERLGYLDGSFGLLVDRLVQGVREAGGEVFTSAPVRRILMDSGRVRGLEVEGDNVHPADAVIATVPSPVMLRLAPELPPGYADLLAGVRYQAALCLVLVLKQPLTSFYWLNISDRSVPFVVAIEHTNLITSAHYGGKHILYLSNYLSPQDPFYGKEQAEVLATYLPFLSRLNPAFTPDWIEESHLFRDDTAQPVVTPSYAKLVPPVETPIAGLYLANITQVYPQDRSMNFSVALGQEASRRVLMLQEQRS